MKKFIFLLLIIFILILTGCQAKIKAVALGDSITYGLPYGPVGSWVRYASNDKTEIINKGVNGETTGQMLSRFAEDVVRSRPDFVIILGGTNDAFYNLSLEQYQNNIAAMVQMARQNKITPVLGIPIPVNEATYESRLKIFRRWLTDYARENKIQVIDFYSALADSGTGYLSNQYNLDNVHPNAAGYHKMAELVSLQKQQKR